MAVIGLQIQETPHPADHVKDWTPEMRYKRVMVGGGSGTQWGNICITHSKKGGGGCSSDLNRSVRCLHAHYSDHY